MSEGTADLAQRWFRDVWGTLSDDAVDVLCAPDVVQHNADGTTVTLAEWKTFRRQLIDAVPDLKVAVEGVVASGDDAVVRWHITGTQRGALFGVGPSDRPIDARGMTWLRVRNGRIVEGWDGWDVGGLVQRLSREAPASATRSASA
jgi:steroid delta-isomerase-like uncharacterized protein